MPVEVEQAQTTVEVTPMETDVSGAALTDEQLRTLAEILYTMIKEELRIERERLGR